MCAPHHDGQWEEWMKGKGEPVGGVRWLMMWLDGWWTCTEEEEMPGGGGPICAAAGTCPGFC